MNEDKPCYLLFSNLQTVYIYSAYNDWKHQKYNYCKVILKRCWKAFCLNQQNTTRSFEENNNYYDRTLTCVDQQRWTVENLTLKKKKMILQGSIQAALEYEVFTLFDNNIHG